MFYQDVPYVESVQQDITIAKQGVELILSQNAQIESFGVIVWNNKVLVGVLPYPLYSRTQRDALETTIKSDINDVYGFDEVLVSFDMDILYEINKLNRNGNIKDENVSKLFNSVKIRRK